MGVRHIVSLSDCIFQLFPAKGQGQLASPTQMLTVPVNPTHIERFEIYRRRDAIESCSTFDGDQARACFAYFGCDRQRVKQYFQTISDLETSLDISGAPQS